MKTTMKAMLGLLAAVLVVGFAFAGRTTNSIWEGSLQSLADDDSRQIIDLSSQSFKAGDKLTIHYEKAGSVAQSESRIAGPKHEMKKYADISIFKTDETKLTDFQSIRGEGTKSYTFEADVEGIIISFWNLTVTKIELETEEEEIPEPATELVNADFSQDTPLDNHLCGYGKDMETNGTTYYGLQEVEGWNKVILNSVTDEKGFEGSGLGGGVFAYGSEYQLKGNQKTAPAAGPNGEAGQALGFFGVWGCGGYYYQTIKLAAGKYTFAAYIYNQSGTQANESYTGFFVNDEVKYTVAINPAVGAWALHTVSFELTEETVGEIRVGYKSTGSGSGANPMIFIDCVKIMSELDAAIEEYDVALNNAISTSRGNTLVTGSEKTALDDAITANSNIDKTSLNAVTAATEALKAATKALIDAAPAYRSLIDAKESVDLNKWVYAAASKKEAVESALNSANNPESADDATAKKNALNNAYRAYIESNAIAEGVEGAEIVANAIVNPNAENGINGWTTAGNGSIDVKSSEPWTDASGNATHNYFDGGNWGANAWDVTFSQDITLAAGKYVLTAITRASGNVEQTLFAGETSVTATVVGSSGNVFDRGWNDVFVEFEMTTEGTVNVGVRGVTSNLHEWMSFSNFRLTCLEAYQDDQALELAKQALEAEISAATTMLNAESNLEAGKTELQAAITEAEAKKESTDASEINAATQALKQAEEAFKKAQDDARELAANTAAVEEAAVTDPVETEFVVNAEFAEELSSEWVATGGFQNNVLKKTEDANAGSMNDNLPWWENWTSSANKAPNKMSQMIENIPNGVYKLKIKAFVNALAEAPATARANKAEEAGQTVQYVFANNDKVYLTEEAKQGAFYEVYTQVTENKVEIGLEQTEGVANWMGIDDVSLKYYGNETTTEEAEEADNSGEAALKDAIDALNAEIATAEALLNGTSQTEGRTEFEAAIDAAKVLLSSTDVDAINAGVATLKEAEEAFKIAGYYIYDGVAYIIDAESGKFMAAGHDYGTRGIINEIGLDLTFTSNETTRTVTIDSKVSNGGDNHFLGNNLYMDSPAFGWILKYQGFGFYITDGTQYINIDDNDNLVLSDTPREWIIVTDEGVKTQRLEEMAEATKDSPISATWLLQNPNFNRNDQRVNAWQVSEDCTNKNLNGGNNVNNCAESFHSTFTISQVIEGAPAGVYALTAQGFYRQDGSDNDNLPVFFANDETMTFPAKTGSENSMSEASASFSNGLYTIEPIYVQVEENGTLTVGAKLETNTNLWCIFDNFQLTYYGASATIDEVKNAAILEEMKSLIATANGMKDQVEVNAVKTALENAVAEASSASGAEAINAAIATLREAIDKAEASVKAKNVLPTMKAFTESTNFYTAEALNNYYTQWNNKYEAGTLTKAEANALQDPNTVTGWRADNMVDDLLMSVWDENPMNWNSYHVNTWSTEGESDGSNFKVPFIEYWTGDDASLGARELTATIEGLDPYFYGTVQAWVRVRVKNGNTDAATGITMQVNDGTPVDVCTGQKFGEQYYLDTFEALGQVDKDGKLVLKFQVAEGNNISWLSFKDIIYTTATAINSINADNRENNAIYNLNGQKVQKAQKGLFIINGKKVVVK